MARAAGRSKPWGRAWPPSRTHCSKSPRQSGTQPSPAVTESFSLLRRVGRAGTGRVVGPGSGAARPRRAPATRELISVRTNSLMLPAVPGRPGKDGGRGRSGALPGSVTPNSLSVVTAPPTQRPAPGDGPSSRRARGSTCSWCSSTTNFSTGGSRGPGSVVVVLLPRRHHAGACAGHMVRPTGLSTALTAVSGSLSSK